MNGHESPHDEQVNGVERDVHEINVNLFSSSTKARIGQLNELSANVAAGGMRENSGIASHYIRILILTTSALSSADQTTTLNYLTATATYYDDRNSRRAATDCLRTYFKSEQSHVHLGAFVTFLQHENRKAVYAPSSLSLLVQWCSVALQEIIHRPELWPKHGLQVVELQADLLDKCLAAMQHDRPQKRASVLRQSWSGIRAIARNKELGNEAVGQVMSALTAKKSSPRPGNAPLLGGIAGTCDRKAKVTGVLHEHTSDFTTYYIRELLGSKVPLPSHVTHGLDSFFSSSAMSADLFEREFAPAIEKAVLRSPEVVLHGLLPATVQSLPPNIDLSWSLKKHLLKPLLSAVKSSNVNVKEGCLTAFEAISSRCHDPVIQKEVAQELSKLVKETKPAEQRALQSHMLAAIASRSLNPDTLSSDVASVVPKEGNEQALEAEAQVVRFQVLTALSAGDKPGDPLFKAFSQGLSDKKPTIRRIWALQLGHLIWSMDAEALARSETLHFLEAVVGNAVKSCEDVLANPVIAAQAGAVTVAYVVIAACLTRLNNTESSSLRSLTQSSLFKNARGTDGKQSFLTNHRVYSKLIADGDVTWFMRALAAVFENAPDTCGSDWGQAVLFIVTASSSGVKPRQEADRSLRKLCVRAPGSLVSAIVEGLWHWLRSVSLEEKDTPATAARTGKSRLYQVFRPICTALKQLVEQKGSDERRSIDSLLIRLLVLCREPLIPRTTWIDICIRSGVDPSSLVSAEPEACMTVAQSRAQDRSDAMAEETFTAACSAIAELAFISPQSITPKIVSLLQVSLDPQQLEGIGPTEAAIFRTPEGVAFVDVLSQKPRDQLPEKGNTKDYEVLKWEQELRDQVAKKAGQQKKLTSEEQSKVKAQLAKEAEIRAQVQDVASKLQRGIGVISSLASGPPTEAESWIGPAVHNLMGAINAGAGLIVGDTAALAYLALAQQTSSRLGTLRQFIGVATLRAQGASQLPPALEEEDLAGLLLPNRSQYSR